MNERQARARKERERATPDPSVQFWKSLVERVHASSGGFDTLSEAEKLYFAVSILVGEVYNGGFYQFFRYYSGFNAYAHNGLMALGAVRTLRLLKQAKNVYESVAARTDLPAEPLVRGQFLVVRQPAEFVDKLKPLDQQF